MSISHEGKGKDSFTPAKQAFDPANAVVKAGIVPLNKLSKYLADLPDTATALLLVSPKDTASLLGRSLETWNTEIKDIATILKTDGIHFDGKALAGMPLSDCPRYAPHETYEKAWAQQITLLWKRACKSGQPVTTGLAMATMPIVCGRQSREHPVTLENNLHARAGDINEALRRQGGQEIVTDQKAGDARWQFAASASPHQKNACCVDFNNGQDYCTGKDDHRLPSRPIALHILPPER